MRAGPATAGDATASPAVACRRWKTGAMTSYSPAQASERTGLSLDALRYYEREGLIGPIDRGRSGHRRYFEDDVVWIGIVTCLRDAGLGSEDLRRFTELLRGSTDPADRVGFLLERREELRERLETTRCALDVLADKIEHYSSVG